MTTLQFNQILPSQKMPVLAKAYAADIPNRAKAFCYPFKAAKNAGVYFFPPLDFEFKLTDQQFLLRAKTTDGEYKTVTITESCGNGENHFILLSDIAPSQSEKCLKTYRARVNKDSEVPDFIDVDNFGFYEILINVLVEEAPFGVFIQLWLGGVVTTNPGTPLWFKQATNIQMDPGYQCLDAIVDVSHWQGWLAIVLKPTRKDEWVSVDANQPVCQAVGYPGAIEQLQNIPMAQVTDKLFSAPLHWHVYDCDYGMKPGKYQRTIKKAR
ncbi:MAG: hypothetical protein HRT35_31450 [Algicola sp.]|nr:hypothetical protein [Algicola sp.]